MFETTIEPLEEGVTVGKGLAAYPSLGAKLF